MLKMNRLATFAAALLLALPIAVIPLAAQAQAQPAAPAPSAAPADTSTPPAASPPPPVAPAAPAAAPAPAPAGKAATEIIENPYGLEALWKGGDLVARITLGILVLMSEGSWYIIVTKLYEQAKMGQQARAADRSFWKAPSVQKGAVELKDGSPFRFIAEAGLESTTKHEG